MKKTVLLVLVLAFAGFDAAKLRADDAVSRFIFGAWRDPKSGDSYQFERDQSYIFRAGPQKRWSGNLSHSGVWQLVVPQPKFAPYDADLKPLTLHLRAQKRKVLRQGRVRTRTARRVFQLPLPRVSSQTPPGVPVYLSHAANRYYYRDPQNPAKVFWLDSPQSQNRLTIEKTAFVRVK